ncbi:MAG: VapC toxin family PIN domain ribonuclease, partial [Xanthobacteraceae bacterium]|nr:VapC toxin family PIN domain ribonuclease [Xanthobacteraceae bacterium]
ASCPLTENGFIRIVSQPRYPTPIPLKRALELMAKEIARTDHRFWPDDVSLTDSSVFEYDRILGPKQLTDIYLLSLAVKNGGRLATFDQAIGFAAVRGADAQHLVLI